MPDRKKEPETVPSTISAEQSQKGKKCKKKFSKNPRQNIQKNIPVQDDMQQMGSGSFPKPNPQREFNVFSNLKEFPRLVGKDNEVRSSQFQKSWSSFTSCRENGNDLNEVPTVPYAGNCKKKNDSLISKKNEQEKTYKQENPVVDKADSSSTSKIKGKVKPDNNNVKLTQSREKTETQRNPIKKKRADPVLINLNEILEMNRSHKKTKQHKTFKSKSHRFDNTERLSGNILDSSNPKRSKGKHREIKKKKLTNLKLLILKERIIKQKLEESQVDGNPECSYSDLIENINFKEEIVKYLKELDEKKIKMKESSKNKDKQSIETGVKNEIVDEKLIENKDEDQKVGCLKEKNNCSLDKPDEVESVSKTKEEKETLISCKVREYCENIITPTLNSAVTELIKEVVSLQDKLFARDPVKAKAKRRHVSGFREVKKFLNLKKVKMIVIPPNLEKLQMKGSVFDLISELKEMANIQNVPYVFALDRYKLGKCTRKNVPVGAFAVLNYEGLEDRFKNVLVYLQEARQQFADIMSKTTAKIDGENTAQGKQQTGDKLLETMIKDEKESKEENSDEDVSQEISAFITSLRELSDKK